MMNWVIKKIFQKRYKYFEYPFGKADELLMKMNSDEREAYLEAVDKWVNSKAFDMEHKEIVRKFYQELALGNMEGIDVSSKEMQAGYRLACLFMKRHQQRMQSLSQQYNQLYKLNNSYAEKINTPKATGNTSSRER